MTQVDQFFMSPPDQFLMSFDTYAKLFRLSDHSVDEVYRDGVAKSRVPA